MLFLRWLAKDVSDGRDNDRARDQIESFTRCTKYAYRYFEALTKRDIAFDYQKQNSGN